MLQTELLAYLAGILDGEGCLGIVKVKKSDRNSLYYATYVAIGMVDAQPLELFHANFGGYMAKVERSKKNPRHRDYWIWRLRGARLHDMLTSLLPYLLVKKRQAEILIQFRSTLLKVGHPRGAKLQDEDYRWREEFYQQIRSLNTSHLRSLGQVA